MKSLREMVQEAEDPNLNLYESRKKDATVTIGGRTVDFGSDIHKTDLKKTLAGLERLRDCYDKGSGPRLVFASACQRLRKLLKDMSPQQDSQQQSLQDQANTN
jgi:hypothetical protein